MVSKQSVEEQLIKLGFSLHGWGQAEIRELPNVLLPGEGIYELVNGSYEGGFALLVATDVRLLLIDKKPMNYLTVEDIRFEMISEIDYSHRLLGAQIGISTGYKDLHFRSYNQQRLRKLISHVQTCMFEAKKQQSQSQVGQNQHLERLNEQLDVYLKAQGEYQLQLQRIQAAQKAGAENVPEPTKPTPSPELSDYLFARSLLAQYQAQTGKKVESELPKVLPQTSETVKRHVAAVTNAELHELWSAGMKEVFGKHKRLGFLPTTGSVTVKLHHNSFEINPVSIVFSRLPMLIRNRRFGRPISQLSSDNATG